MTYLASLTPNTIHAKAQQEAFAQLKNAGRRVPVVFSHVLLTHISNNQIIRKGVLIEKSTPAPGAKAPSRFFSNLTKEVPGTILS